MRKRHRRRPTPAEIQPELIAARYQSRERVPLEYKFPPVTRARAGERFANLLSQISEMP